MIVSRQSAIHMWAHGLRKTASSSGNSKTDAKSNEITAIPELLQVLWYIRMYYHYWRNGCQKNIAEIIIKKEADYVFALKANHENLFKEVTLLLPRLNRITSKMLLSITMRPLPKDHGRLEIRRYWVMNNLSEFKHIAAWKNIRLIGMVESERTVRGKTRSSEDTIFPVSKRNASFLLKLSVYIGVSRILSTGSWIWPFEKMNPRVRKRTWPENLAILRHIALNLLRDDSTRLGIKKQAYWERAVSTEYLTTAVGLNGKFNASCPVAQAGAQPAEQGILVHAREAGNFAVERRCGVSILFMRLYLHILERV